MPRERGIFFEERHWVEQLEQAHIFAPMLILLSPAKDLDMMPMHGKKGATQPEFLAQSKELVQVMQKKSVRQLIKLMDISPALAELNEQRFKHWELPFTTKNAKMALYAFNGEVYRGMDAKTMTNDDLRFAQDHLRILSGLYGLLRPMDLMQAYRLEMGCGLKVRRNVANLYDFWGDRITDQINDTVERTGSKCIVDLASKEYFSAVAPTQLSVPVIRPVFKDLSKGTYRMLMVFAKQQRGRMARYIIEHRAMRPEILQKYDLDGYRYRPEMSDDQEWVFTRDERP